MREDAKMEYDLFLRRPDVIAFSELMTRLGVIQPLWDVTVT